MEGTSTEEVFWVIERSASLVSRDRVRRGGAIPLEEGGLWLLTIRLPSLDRYYCRSIDRSPYSGEREGSRTIN
jgi:hypothetical protein